MSRAVNFLRHVAKRRKTNSQHVKIFALYWKNMKKKQTGVILTGELLRKHFALQSVNGKVIRSLIEIVASHWKTASPKYST